MRTVYIIYTAYLDKNGKKITIGGIQTYINQLIKVIKQRNDVPVIVQFANKDFSEEYEETKIIGVDIRKIKGLKKQVRALLRFIKKDFVVEDDLLLFATHTLYVPSYAKHELAIQHGIYWDVPYELSQKSIIREVISAARISYTTLHDLEKLKNLVCVDYNFVNWYKTQVKNSNKNFVVIPNCTRINESDFNKPADQINIIFARRFEVYRGTRLFAQAIKEVLKNFDNINVTFAGTGPDDTYLKNQFKNNQNVDFISYESKQSLDIHQNYHIAVVPSLGSEGTSLSLLEAMASKCAVIATNVGGMTNIIIDNYNGLLINPDKTQLVYAIEKLIVDDNLRNILSLNAFNTVLHAFNSELWEERWNRVFNQVLV